MDALARKGGDSSSSLTILTEVPPLLGILVLKGSWGILDPNHVSNSVQSGLGTSFVFFFLLFFCVFILLGWGGGFKFWLLGHCDLMGVGPK